MLEKSLLKKTRTLENPIQLKVDLAHVQWGRNCPDNVGISRTVGYFRFDFRKFLGNFELILGELADFHKVLYFHIFEKWVKKRTNRKEGSFIRDVLVE